MTTSKITLQEPKVEAYKSVDPASPQAGERTNYLATNRFGRERAFTNEATARRWANR